jgi:hypothetical protein|tara:strand:+ start:30175 stop:30426 length:252 start_codon:yes stop_codon:yes gene_type:complete
MNKKEEGQILDLTKVVYELKGLVEQGREENKEAHRKTDEHFEKLNGTVEKHSTFIDSMKGGLKLSAWLLGSGIVVTLIYIFII